MVVSAILGVLYIVSALAFVYSWGRAGFAYLHMAAASSRLRQEHGISWMSVPIPGSRHWQVLQNDAEYCAAREKVNTSFGALVGTFLVAVAIHALRAALE